MSASSASARCLAFRDFAAGLDTTAAATRESKRTITDVRHALKRSEEGSVALMPACNESVDLGASSCKTRYCEPYASGTPLQAQPLLAIQIALRGAAQQSPFMRGNSVAVTAWNEAQLRAIYGRHPQRVMAKDSTPSWLMTWHGPLQRDPSLSALMSATCAALTSSSQPEASRVTGVKRSRSEAAPPARKAPARRTVACKASQHAEPMDRLLEACRVFLPGRTRSAARTARDRLACVLSVDRETLPLGGEHADAGDPRAALLLQKRVKAVLEEYVDLHQGGVASSALQSHVDEAGMQFAVKRSKPAFC